MTTTKQDAFIQADQNAPQDQNMLRVDQSEMLRPLHVHVDIGVARLERNACMLLKRTAPTRLTSGEDTTRTGHEAQPCTLPPVIL